jgi:hypothetical protein
MGMIGVMVPVTPERLERLHADATSIDDFESGRAVSLEKMWHGLHFLLTGSVADIESTPLARALLGGSPIGEDRGYGPARFLTPDQVRAIADALAATSFDEAWKRFDPEQMTMEGVYPGVWDEEESDLRHELGTYYAEMASCYAAAAEAGDGMLLVIT